MISISNEDAKAIAVLLEQGAMIAIGMPGTRNQDRARRMNRLAGRLRKKINGKQLS